MTWGKLGLWVFIATESALGVIIVLVALLLLWSTFHGGKRGK